MHVASAIFVAAALGNEVLDVLLANRELQEVGKHLLQISRRDVVLITLVKQLEALSRLLLLASLVPFGLDDGSDKVKLYYCSLFEIHVSALQVRVNLLLATGWLVVSEVVQDISEVSDGNVTVLLLIIILEGIVQVCEHLGGESRRPCLVIFIQLGWINVL